MSRRRWVLLLTLMSACNAELRLDPSFSCSGSTRPVMPVPDAGLADPCQRADCAPFTIAAGAQHSCASLWQGEVGSTVCWGRNDHHQASESDDPLILAPAPTRFGGASSLSASVLHTCAVDPPRLGCWGTNTAGLLGWPVVGATYAEQVPWVEIGAPIAVTTGAGHTCTLDDDMAVRCHGDNSSGQLGPDLRDPYLALRGIWAEVEAPEHVDAGGRRTCATSDGQIVCWGEARETIEWAGEPLRGIAVGPTHACVVAEDVRCWGQNDDGQLGIGSREPRDAPDLAVSLPARARGVSVGGFIPVEVASPTALEYGSPSRAHTCALLEDGDVFCWGANDRGQLGDGTTEDRPVPVRVLLEAPARALSAGGAHTCAIAGDVVYCWGANDHAQLARDPSSLPFSASPVRVEL